MFNNKEINKFWVSKYNLYSLSYFLTKNNDLDSLSENEILEILNGFIKNEDSSNEYRRLAQERGNDLSTRIKRNEILEKIFNPGQNK